jgi:hypothetical protein
VNEPYVEVAERVVGEVDGGHAGEHPGVRELGDLGGEDHAAGVAVALVPAPARQAGPVLAEAGEVGGLSQVRGRGDEEGSPVALAGVTVDPGTPRPEGGPVGLLLPRLPVHLGRVGTEVRDHRVGEDPGATAEVEAGERLGHPAGQLQEPI